MHCFVLWFSHWPVVSPSMSDRFWVSCSDLAHRHLIQGQAQEQPLPTHPRLPGQAMGHPEAPPRQHHSPSLANVKLDKIPGVKHPAVLLEILLGAKQYLFCLPSSPYIKVFCTHRDYLFSGCPFLLPFLLLSCFLLD